MVDAQEAGREAEVSGDATVHTSSGAVLCWYKNDSGKSVCLDKGNDFACLL